MSIEEEDFFDMVGDIILASNENVALAIEKIDNSVPAKAEAIANVIKAKEETNRVALNLYADILWHYQSRRQEAMNVCVDEVVD